MIYSVGGTLGMLLATQLVGWTAGTFDIEQLAVLWPAFEGTDGAFLGIDIQTVKSLSFVGFFVAFLYQSTCVAFPYLATRCTWRSTNSRFNALGRCHAEAGCLWFPSLGPFLCSQMYGYPK